MVSEPNERPRVCGRGSLAPVGMASTYFCSRLSKACARGSSRPLPHRANAQNMLATFCGLKLLTTWRDRFVRAADSLGGGSSSSLANDQYVFATFWGVKSSITEVMRFEILWRMFGGGWTVTVA
eukprot:CAMPEP_0185277268 /NCGR_PEP_ID=MMETSP1359-20130426/58210_1 /TAXON_ID=552665 /ORGANISM="Bigelowiella longifila, Strain CCMP242" /LENGTH=123 /DNA_ID=CAMNT_0027871315 /DNA_START=104 /DNA_END=475 /DNA_ORIENTATION=-